MYPHQSERLNAVLEREGLAALVATTAANVGYLAGFRSLTRVPSHIRFAVFTPQGAALVVPAVEVPAIVADGLDVAHIVGVGRLDAQYVDGVPASERVRALVDRRAASPAEGLARALEMLGVRGRIGLDEGALTAQAWQQVITGLSALTVVPAADLLGGARRVKSPYEIECLARALSIAEEAANAVIQALKPGTTESEAVTAYGTEVLKRGGELVASSIAFGERTWIPAAGPTDRALRAGDLVCLDLGCAFKGYHASLARVAVTGQPSERQEALHQAAQSGLETAVAAVAPGSSAARVHQAGVAAVCAAGRAAFEPDHLGYGIGLEPYELPRLAADASTPLEAGEVLRVELTLLGIGWAGLSLRDTVLVTTRARQVLNRSTRALVLLD